MMYLVGFGRRGCLGLKPALCAVIVMSAAAAGCSADVTRFDSSSFNLNDPPQETAAAPAPVEPVAGHSDYNNPVSRSQPRGPYGAGAGQMTPPAASGIEMANLPDATPPAPAAPVMRPAAYRPAAPAAAAPAVRQPVAKGETFDVQPGDTLYGLSKRHQVSLAELMSVNDLTGPNLKPGQKLYLPAGKALMARPASRAAPMTTAALSPAPAAPAAAAPAEMPAPPMAPPSAEVAAKYTSSYQVKPGDSLYVIARANKVPFMELQQVNGITDPKKVMPGTTLKVPAGTVAVAEVQSTAGELKPTAVAPVVAASTEAALVAPRVTQQPAQPTIINSGTPVAATGTAVKGDKIAAAAPQAVPQAAVQAASSTRLRWPANGKIIAGFGGRPDGTHNDGINLSVPLGTEVHAAENGVVAYAGSELKGYGNLVLVRHDNGWVTAYAHNDETLVKRGDKVKRGQVIAKAGKTGTVDQPQVHFELRQGSKPVDPTPFMEKL